MSKWKNVEVLGGEGSRKAKLALKLAMTAVSGLGRLRTTTIEINGVVGGPESRAQLMTMFATETGHEEYDEAYAQAIGAFEAKYACTIDSANAEEITKEATELYKELHAKLPVVDKRRSPEEEVASQQRIAEHRKKLDEEKARRDEAHSKALALKPSGAKRYIIAEYEVDKCDSMSDYYATETTQAVLIGFSSSSRESLKNCRRAAADFEPTAELAEASKEKSEQRPNYGWPKMYLGFGGTYDSGWRVFSVKELSPYGPVMEIADHLTKPEKVTVKPLPQVDDDPEANCLAESILGGNSESYEIEEHVHTKKSFTMYICVAKQRVERSVFEAERDRCKEAGGWYSRKWGCTPGGFAFKEREAAQAFIANAVMIA